jgi:hypothetical protein
VTAPVALVLFNRPATTRLVFERIRQARPQRLFLIADGPRSDRPKDAALCAAARAAVAEVDWPCEVERDYSEVNLGCGRRVASGLDRVFARVEEAIVLEDDTLPDPSFFSYCSELLDRLRCDASVFYVCGRNDLGEWPAGGADYFFSRHGSIWGWATWRRAWSRYDFRLSAYHGEDAEARLRRVLPDRDHAEHQCWLLRQHAGEMIDTWDIQWTLTCMMEGGLAAMPRVNLVANLGFAAQASHTRNGADVRAELAAVPLPPPLVHPGGPPRRHVDDRFDRASFLLHCMATFTDVRRLFLWQRLLARGAPAPPGVNDGLQHVLAPLRSPREALAVLERLRSSLPHSDRLAQLIADMAWAARAC